MKPKKREYVLIGVQIAETGLEYLTFQSIGQKTGRMAQTIYYHFPGGAKELRECVVQHALQHGNRRIICQLIAMRDPAVHCMDRVTKKGYLRSALA